MNHIFSRSSDDRAFPVIAGMDEDLITALNGWRLAQDSELDPNEAILCLLRRALAVEGCAGSEPLPKLPVAVNPALDALVEAFQRASGRR